MALATYIIEFVVQALRLTILVLSLRRKRRDSVDE